MFSKLVLVAALAVCGAAQAKDVRVATRGDAKATLTDETSKDCPAGTKVVRLLQGGEKSEGCWIETHGKVFIFFEDGYGVLDADEFEKVASL